MTVRICCNKLTKNITKGQTTNEITKPITKKSVPQMLRVKYEKDDQLMAPRHSAQRHLS